MIKKQYHQIMTIITNGIGALQLPINLSKITLKG